MNVGMGKADSLVSEVERLARDTHELAVRTSSVDGTELYYLAPRISPDYRGRIVNIDLSCIDGSAMKCSSDAVLNVHSLNPLSMASSFPMRSAVIHLQGCQFGCKGCWNRPAQSLSMNKLFSAGQLVKWLKKCDVGALVISGGEPMLQCVGVRNLFGCVRSELSDLSIIVFTGFHFTEWTDEMQDALRMADLVKSGLFDSSRIRLNGILTSENQMLVRINPHFNIDTYDAGGFEIIVSRNSIDVCGFPPQNVRQLLQLHGMGGADHAKASCVCV